MFYEVKNGHGLPHDPFKSCIVPRPIQDGSQRSAPTGSSIWRLDSFSCACGDDPLQAMYAPLGQNIDGDLKDSLTNVEATGEFVANMVTWELRDQMNQTGVTFRTPSTKWRFLALKRRPHSWRSHHA